MEWNACGLSCGDCPYREGLCGGCRERQGIPFWRQDSGVCPIYSCTADKGVCHCGYCPQMPCGIWEGLKDPSESEEDFQKLFAERQRRLLEDRPSKTDFRRIPGVGKITEQDLINLGYTCIASLRGEDPEEMYRRECKLKGCLVDRCQLYVYRLAVYFAETPEPDPEKLRWWKWKD